MFFLCMSIRNSAPQQAVPDAAKKAERERKREEAKKRAEERRRKREERMKNQPKGITDCPDT